MKLFGWNVSRTTATPPPPLPVRQLVDCKVRVVVHNTQTEFFYSWDLVSPRRLTKLQQAELNVRVGDHCKRTVLAASDKKTVMNTVELTIQVTP